MTEKEREERLQTAQKVATEVTDGMRRPPGTEWLGYAVKEGRQQIYYYNGYTYPNYYVRVIRCEADLKAWK